METQLETVPVVGAAIFKNGRCLVTRRGPDMSEPGKWEFPGGKVEADESPTEALAREVREELNLDIDVGPVLAVGESIQGSRRIQLTVYRAEARSALIKLREHSAFRWMETSDLDRLDWPEADLPAVKALLQQAEQSAQ